MPRVCSDHDTCVRRYTADYTNRRSKSLTKYAAIADHSDVPHVLAVSHVVGHVASMDPGQYSAVLCRRLIASVLCL